MKTRSFSHLSDHTLLRAVAETLAQDCGTTATLLALLAEVDARKLYLPAGYPSMFMFCVHELHMSADVAFKRIRAARAARRFPVILERVVGGQLHLSAVVMLTPYLREATVDELLAAATHKTKAEIEQLLAERFPRPDLPAEVHAIAGTLPVCQLAPEPVGTVTEPPSPGVVGSAVGLLSLGPACTATESSSPAMVEVPAAQFAPGQVETRRPRVVPLAPQRFALQLTMAQSTHDKLRRAQALLGHQVPSGDVAQVLDRALDALIRELEKRKLAATDRPRPGTRSITKSTRHIPAEVRRAVWERDQGQCTFVSETGHRCLERTGVEFDHVDPVARGGLATVSRMRLRCRAHNQYEAERVFGTEFMSEKRRSAQCAAAQRRTAVATLHPAPSPG